MFYEKVNVICPVFYSVDGAWTVWDASGPCSVTCDKGTQVRIRSCMEPVHGGSPCEGSNSTVRGCNDALCPGKSPSVLTIISNLADIVCVH